MGRNQDVTVIGAGLAGAEAAWLLAGRGFAVTLVEMRPEKLTPAHESGDFAELVCSNSLKGQSLDTASGLLKAEMRLFGSILLDVAESVKVPAGDALAVNRAEFAKAVTEKIEKHPNITVVREEITDIPDDRPLIIATGPLTADALAEKIKEIAGGGLHFFDAIAPIIDFDSIDTTKGFFGSRWGKGTDDYLNLPMTAEEYDAFYDALVSAETAPYHDFEKMNVFEGCMPIEELAARGKKTLTFGPLRPVGLEDPVTDRRYHAVLQLRRENLDGTAWNMVGFQTKMKIGEQKRVFSLIPGLEQAEYLRYGSIHRNTYIDGPANIDAHFQWKKRPGVFFAGQITGVEGYVESAASGIMAGLNVALMLEGERMPTYPEPTAFAGLVRHVTGEFMPTKHYVPSNFHFGMLPAPEKRIKDKREKKRFQSETALSAMQTFADEVLS